jgi:hypothetical protein
MNIGLAAKTLVAWLNDLSVITFPITQSFFVWICYNTNIVNCYKDFVLHWVRSL